RRLALADRRAGQRAHAGGDGALVAPARPDAAPARARGAVPGLRVGRARGAAFMSIWACAVLVIALVAACSPAAAPAAGRPAGAPGAEGVAGAGASPSAARPAPIRVVANYAARGTGHSGMWLAYEGGYFAEQGLDVELTNIASTAPSIQAMVAGEVQLVGVDPGASIQASLGGADVVLLFAGSNRPLHSIIAQPRIVDPQALRGGILGITRHGSATHTAALLALDTWGLAPDRDVALRG